MEIWKKLLDELTYHKHPREYDYSLGWKTATSVAGFLAGIIVASIMWYAAYYFRYML